MDALTAPPWVRFGFGRRMGIAAPRPVEGARPTAAAEIPWLSEPPATGLTALREDREAKPPAGEPRVCALFRHGGHRAVCQGHHHPCPVSRTPGLVLD
jgi:hypothetical protein